MYKAIKIVINERNYVLSDLLSKIDYFFAKGSLTESEHSELIAMARSYAAPSKEADLFEKLKELEARVKKLEARNEEVTETTAEEYVPGKWYYAGEKCKENGKTYSCIAPEGVACVWSPSDYPAYWSEEMI